MQQPEILSMFMYKFSVTINKKGQNEQKNNLSE